MSLLCPDPDTWAARALRGCVARGAVAGAAGLLLGLVFAQPLAFASDTCALACAQTVLERWLTRRGPLQGQPSAVALLGLWALFAAGCVLMLAQLACNFESGVWQHGPLPAWVALFEVVREHPPMVLWSVGLALPPALHVHAYLGARDVADAIGPAGVANLVVLAAFGVFSLRSGPPVVFAGLFYAGVTGVSLLVLHAIATGLEQLLFGEDRPRRWDPDVVLPPREEAARNVLLDERSRGGPGDVGGL
ncbi:MAG: hypothetical protein R3F62_12165 [Planctomycetota bacterium]